jgi:hypothetical protein
MTTLTDDTLERLLGEAAAAYDVPDDGPDGVLTELSAVRTRAPLRGRRWAQALAVAAVVAGAFAGGALLDQGRDDTTTQVMTAAGGDEAAPAAEEQVAPSGNLSTGPDAEAFATSSAPAPAAAAPESARTAASAPAPPAPPTAPGAPQDAAVQAPAPDGARVVKTGSLALIVADGKVTPTLTAVQELATTAGGVVASAETQESGATPSGSVTLRVPVEQFEVVVTRVRSLDAEVRTATTSGRDVTAEYTDLEAQLRTLRAARERFLAILAETRAIGDILAVQQRVDETTGQIDRLEGQRALLQSQSEMSTLTVTVTEADDPVVRVNEKPDDGLSKAFRDAWDGFTSGVEAIVAASGRAVLLLLCAAVLLVVLRLGWRIGRRRLV